jgi:protein phosphatase
MEVYDTEKSEWTRHPSVSRYRHATALYNRSRLFIHGGFEPELASQPLESMISIDLSPLNAIKPALNNWMQSNPHNMTGTLKDAERNVLAQNDNITNLIVSNTNNKDPSKAMPRRDMKENECEKNRSSRIRSGTSNIGKKERELTPSRIINANKNIRLSSQVIVATGDHVSMMQIQKVPVNSLLEESKRLIAPQEEVQFHDISSL